MGYGLWRRVDSAMRDVVRMCEITFAAAETGQIHTSHTQLLSYQQCRSTRWQSKRAMRRFAEPRAERRGRARENNSVLRACGGRTDYLELREPHRAPASLLLLLQNTIRGRRPLGVSRAAVRVTSSLWIYGSSPRRRVRSSVSAAAGTPLKQRERLQIEPLLLRVQVLDVCSTSHPLPRVHELTTGIPNLIPSIL